MYGKLRCSIFLCSTVLSLTAFALPPTAQPEKSATAGLPTDTLKIVSAQNLDATTVVLQLSNRQRMLLDFYGDNIFRLFYDKSGGSLRDPQASPPARILVEHPRKAVSGLAVRSSDSEVTISTVEITVVWNKASTRMRILNKKKHPVVECSHRFSLTKRV